MLNTVRLFIVSAVLLVFAASSSTQAQQDRWQQRVEYTMEIDMNVETHRLNGTQELVYYNNSPDTLHKVFYHLYFNAFQPGSMMDVRSRTIEDPDDRVGDRIFHLNENEIGFQKINTLEHEGKKVDYEVQGTILEVSLNKPILPGSKTTFEMDFTAQVPLQIRRSGRDSDEGIAYSMTQWYPKISEYDHMGWHANPYVGREFHGVWGDFDVKITLDADYTVGASGYLQNPEEVGHGYPEEGEKVKKNNRETLTWHFIAPKVHDFAWAADPDYIHTTAQVPGGPKLHFFYQENVAGNWEKLPEYTIKAFEYMNEHFGKYPYETYSVIQGGDGGMEYAMATLITGQRKLSSLVGVTVHELVHSWYQHVLANNESLYPWMDEGFTTYASALIMNELFDRESDPLSGAYRSYLFLTESGKEEPMSTHADQYHTNLAYGIAAYSKGAILVNQLGYVIGKEALDKGMKRYYNTWKFRHPEPNDFKRVMEKVSGLELDWYFNQFINTTNTIDYAIKSVISRNGSTNITLEKVGRMMMPIDLKVTYRDGSEEMFYIPLAIMRGEKDKEDTGIKRTVKPDWPWTNPTYGLTVGRDASEIASVEIDPSGRMADVDRSNNRFDFEGVQSPGNGAQ